MLIICYSSKAHATYLISIDEYEGLATKINKKSLSKPIVVFIEMPEVEKTFSKVGIANLLLCYSFQLFFQQKRSENRLFLLSDDEERDKLGGQGDDTDSDKVSLDRLSDCALCLSVSENSLGLSKVDYELARYRQMLEKKYATDHDGTYSYIDPTTAMAIPLTPFLMKEWARAMVCSLWHLFGAYNHNIYYQYDGVAMVNNPPHTVTFDLSNRRSSLAPRNRAYSSTSSSSIDISTLSAVSSLFSSVASFIHPSDRAAIPALPLPSTPKNLHDKLVTPVISTPPPIFNTPSKLERFLQAAERNGVPGVVSFYALLSVKGYGPDIMHIINVSDLVEIGMPPGDAIWLKEFAAKWWADEWQCVAKRPHNAETTPPHPRPVNSTPPNKWLRFEKRFNDGGAARYYGPDVRSGNHVPNHEDNNHTWWVFSKELAMFVPVPMGKVPVLESDDRD
jgi:hypothetical protein